MRLLIFSAVVAMLFSGCMLIGGPQMQGSGVVATENRTVSDFNAIDIGGASLVTVKVGDEKSVVVSFDDNLLAILKTEVSGDTLRIYCTENYRTSVGLSIQITTPSLDEIELSGAATMNIEGVNGESMKVTLSGASTSRVSGSVESLNVRTSGDATADLEQLKSTQAVVATSGASKATVSVSESIEADCSGASKVRVMGNPPETKFNTSGGAKVEFVDG